MNLAEEMGKLPEPPNDSHPPLWSFWQHDLWRRAQDDDPGNFMYWPCVYHCMLVDHWWPDVMQAESDYLPVELNYELLNLARRDMCPTSSFRNLIHQTYHILRWQEATGLRIADMQSIYEFGGGYGAMALVCNRLGFRGDYYIYDLPEFSLLQRWYLEQCGVDNVEWDEPAGADLLIACYSLSETDFAERDSVLSHVPADSYLFLYSNKFEQYDNTGYFESVAKWMTDVQHWRHERIEHLPPESWYTWGW